jgi:hypothetical protein
MTSLEPPPPREGGDEVAGPQVQGYGEAREPTPSMDTHGGSRAHPMGGHRPAIDGQTKTQSSTTSLGGIVGYLYPNVTTRRPKLHKDSLSPSLSLSIALWSEPV